MKENSIGISIVIPVYNTGNYLRQCLDSLLSQSFYDYEIICVDDGSTDNSWSILEEYERKYKQVHILRQQHKFAGEARNYGLCLAKGKYVLFLDSDDFFCQDMLVKIWNKAEREKTEILVFNAYQFDNTRNEIIETSWRALRPELFGKGVKTSNEINEIIFNFTVPAAWNKLYLRKFVTKNNLRFQSIKRTNDLYFVFAALSCSSRIGILDEKLIFYRDNNSSSLQGSGEDTPTIFIEALVALRDFLKRNDTWDIFKDSYEERALSTAFYNLSNMKSKENFITLHKVVKESLFPLIEEIKGVNRLQIRLYKNIEINKDVIIYGAGAIAKVIVNLLIYEYNYTVEQIKIVVSDATKNITSYRGINIVGFGDLKVKDFDTLVLIAVNEKKVQDELEEVLLTSGYKNLMRVDNKVAAAFL